MTDKPTPLTDEANAAHKAEWVKHVESLPRYEHTKPPYRGRHLTPGHFGQDESTPTPEPEVEAEPEEISPAVKQDIRSVVSQRLDAEGDRIVDRIFDLLDATKLKWGWCPDCGKRVQVDSVNEKMIVEATKLLVEIGKGKTKENAPPPPPPRVTALEELEELTDDELASIATG